MPHFKPPGQCPVCGEWIPRKVVACDCCGACERSGWKADADTYDGLDLPDEDDSFDYDQFIAKEFGTGRPKRSMSTFWWWVALVLVIALAYGMLSPLWH